MTQFRRHSTQQPTLPNPAMLKIGEATALPVMLYHHWIHVEQPSQSDNDEPITAATIRMPTKNRNSSKNSSAAAKLHPASVKRHCATDDDVNVELRDSNTIKGTEEIQLIVDDDYDEHDVHVSVDAAAELADDPDTTNQSQYHLTYSKLNDKLREKLTPIFNRKHYSSLPQASLSYFDSKSRKNSCNYSAYIYHTI